MRSKTSSIDFFRGGDDITSAQRRRDEIIQLLQAYSFALKKWISNTPELLATITYIHLDELLHWRSSQ